GFIIHRLRAAGVLTIPELFEKRFGKGVRWLAGLFVVLGGVLNMGIFLRLGGEFLVNITGMSRQAHALKWVMTILLGLVLLYTVLGGMLSVLVTDYLQFLVMGLGIVVVSGLVIYDQGWTELVKNLWLCWDGSIPAGQTLKSHPLNPFDSSSFGWRNILWQLLFQVAVVTTWQTTVARVLAAKDEHTDRKSVV